VREKFYRRREAGRKGRDIRTVWTIRSDGKGMPKKEGKFIKTQKSTATKDVIFHVIFDGSFASG
jgi:hypothetical protein